MKNKIPSYKNPPLSEVLLGVQYEPMDAFNITTYGGLWEEFKKDFPEVEHHLKMESQIEKIGARAQSINDLARLKLEPLLSAQLPRAWFISKDGNELLQIQPDRFIRNWRRKNHGDVYPRYEKHMRTGFLNNLERLNGFFQKNDMGVVTPNQCEISYTNHVEVDGAHNMLNEIFLGWSSEYDLTEAGELEDVQVNLKHIIKDENDNFIGRLHVKIQPAFKLIDNKPIFLVELTMRGRPLGSGVEGVMNFMDLGREKIVRSFTKMTTKEMHNLWDREG